MPFPDEIKDRLVTQGVGVMGTTIGIGSKTIIPPNIGQSGGPTAFLTISETGGSGAARTHNGTAVERPTAQLLSRALTYQAARIMLKAAYDALGGAKGLRNISLGATFYQSVTPRQNITDVGLDSSGRVMLSFNIDAEKSPS